MVTIPRPIDPREIRKIRKELGITQEELAKKAGVTQAYIAKLEAGKVDPRLSTLNRILQALLECKKAQPKARDVMSSPVISVKPYDSVEKVIRLMNEHNISQIPVISGNKVVGSITERTLVRQSLEYDDIYGHKVVEVMEEPFPIVNEDEDLEVVKYLLEDHPAVLVQDKAGKIVGIITRVDLFRLGKTLSRE
ncbi:predicted transcription regulator, containing CBS domains [Thermococcus kodakarensis KOD1]|uniref:Predicted transcription regulator, containing CBS domains n=1 Tax=Thermococcus kodakarensis (strain ATCC BAA-918 / JCM 12380 / KOD1) TaxID=69014 RepID=Q5JGL2_THEKO|nr:CBS domain-containing protein [Thermococcus kodakarensis]WCN27266.1 CBS domain-containing protein [Thermococcus kodakarensis]WCN29552.1 CBS domain-containing protein [Thermococcus kodakarensis]BAD85455.1 predicted transcription regulator, containing CBS domains [Thermococcus kodakarensis KOD1]